MLRDVDLFVSVAGVGGDPEWKTRDPDDILQTYWGGHAFMESNKFARMRADLLKLILPRLPIANRARIEEPFLRVRGVLREYRIHFHSGAVLMGPDDRYLCLLPDKASQEAASRVYVPFEGDSMFTLILAKAFMLADDARIKDAAIGKQIRAGG